MIVGTVRFLVVLFEVCSAHSWLLQVGSRGLKRGGLEGTDDDKTRDFCPGDDLNACVAPNSNVVLTADNKRACQKGKSPMMEDINAGADLFLGWQGNGHVGKADESCVKVGIAPYANDPEVSSFQTLVECAPYNHGFSPDTTVTIPASLAPGEYTIFWLWTYAGFYYSSCADINVQTASTAGPTPSTPKMTVEASLALDYNALDCAAVVDPDGACIARFGPTTYCLTWVKNTCGRSWCQGHDPVSDCTLNASQGTTTVAPSVSTTHAPPATSVSTTNSPPATSGSPTNSPPATSVSTTQKPEVTAPNVQTSCDKQTDPNGYCRKQFGNISYCKLGSKDSCGRSWCFSQVSMPPC